MPLSRPAVIAIAAAACAAAGAQVAVAGTPGASCTAHSVSFRASDVGRFTWTLPVALRYAASAKVQVRRSGTTGEFVSLSNVAVSSSGTRTQQAGVGSPRLDAGSWDWRMFLTEWDGTLITCDGPAFTITRLPQPGIVLSGAGITSDGWRAPGSGQTAGVVPGPGDSASGARSLVRFRYSSGWWTGWRSAPASLPTSDITAIEARRRTADGLLGDVRSITVRRDSWAPSMPVPHADAIEVGESGGGVSFAASTDWLSGVSAHEARVVSADGKESAWKTVAPGTVAVAGSAAGGTLLLRACDRVGNCSAAAEVEVRRATGPITTPAPEPSPAPAPAPAAPPAPRPAAGQKAPNAAAAARARRAAAAAIAPRITALVPRRPRGGAGRVTVELTRPAEVTFAFRGTVIARAWLGAGRTHVRLPAQARARRGALVARPSAGSAQGEPVTTSVALPRASRKGEAARRTTAFRAGATGVLYDLDAAVREVVDPLDGAPGFTHVRGALRQEPSTSGLFAPDDDRSQMGKVTEEDLRGLPPEQLAQVLRDAIERSDSHLVAFDELTPYESDRKGPVVKGGRIPPADPDSPGAHLAQAMAMLDTPSPYGGTWASRVHIYVAPAVTSAIAAGRGPDRNWGRDGKARFRTYRTVMTGLARAGAVWIEAYHGKTVPLQPFTAKEWRRAPAAFAAEYRRAGGDISRLRFLLTGTDAYPRGGRLPAACTTPMACQWALAEGTAAGRAILANGVGGYRLGAHARPWLAEWQARVS